ncbi:hypothetical protein QYS60_01475 [Rhodococcus sp. GXMU-t2271]|uniref:Lipid A biosynthesis lauroyl acyltransferase n=1 Tax=Rhodococcus indonesiensis TaxID=3055869 RepID=A0ABT7RJN3_9NOCA|nr:hypothetical protein [Rhodococcus indonesiensis]
MRALPQQWAMRMFEVAADGAARGGGPVQLRRNLARCCPPPQRRCLTSWCARACAPTPGTGARRSGCRRWIVVRLAERVESVAGGLEHIHRAIEGGRGAVLAVTHSGNWDPAGPWPAQRIGSPTVVAERLAPESLFRRVVLFRKSLGFEFVPPTGGATPPYEHLRERLR